VIPRRYLACRLSMALVLKRTRRISTAGTPGRG
jgi:hypothetical protein